MDFDIDLELPRGLAVVDVPIQVFGNGVVRSQENGVDAGPILTVPPATGSGVEPSGEPTVAGVRVHIHAFYRSRS